MSLAREPEPIWRFAREFLSFTLNALLSSNLSRLCGSRPQLSGTHFGVDQNTFRTGGDNCDEG